jgi:hypothetical protein
MFGDFSHLANMPRNSLKNTTEISRTSRLSILPSFALRQAPPKWPPIAVAKRAILP